MAWFNKNKKEKETSETEKIPSLPSLPPLPKLPSLPPSSMQFKPNSLPKFPTSSFGEKFSHDTIKDAISGEKEGEEENANESEEIQMMPEIPEGPLTKEVSSMENEPLQERKFRPNYPMKSEGGPIFVRLDKFEENLEIFNRIKRQLSGVEKILEDIKRTKEQEDKELGDWESKLQTMKEQIDKIDKDIFSKVE